MAFKVLIVDDDKTILFLHKFQIVKNGISKEPLTFVNGKEAMDFLLTDDSQEPYFVFLDINMPVMNGWQFLDELQEKQVAPKVHVAIVTSSIDRADREKAEKYDRVCAYLTKPFSNLEAVKKMIEELPQRGN